MTRKASDYSFRDCDGNEVHEGDSLESPADASDPIIGRVNCLFLDWPVGEPKAVLGSEVHASPYGAVVRLAISRLAPPSQGRTGTGISKKLREFLVRSAGSCEEQGRRNLPMPQHDHNDPGRTRRLIRLALHVATDLNSGDRDRVIEALIVLALRDDMAIVFGDRMPELTDEERAAMERLGSSKEFIARIRAEVDQRERAFLAGYEQGTTDADIARHDNSYQDWTNVEWEDYKRRCFHDWSAEEQERESPKRGSHP